MGIELPEMFTDETPLPETVFDCDTEIADLIFMIQGIDLQITYHKQEVGLGHRDDWHPRALAKQRHIQRRLAKVRAHRGAIKAEEREVAERMKLKAKLEKKMDNARIEMQKAREGAGRHKRRFKALQNWAWESFPERRDEIAEVIAAAEQTAPES